MGGEDPGVIEESCEICHDEFWNDGLLNRHPCLAGPIVTNSWLPDSDCYVDFWWI